MKKLNLIIDNNFYVKNRESSWLEFKEKFHKDIKRYVKTIAAFANNKGGYIIFGVKDSPRKAIGLSNYSEFRDFEGSKLSTILMNTLSGTVECEFDEKKEKIAGKEIVLGVLKVKEATNKPIICKISDNSNKLREGAIYYRYYARNLEIKAGDLERLLQERIKKEIQIFLKHIKTISEEGPSNVGILSYNGHLNIENRKLLIDKSLVDKLKIIKAGQFVQDSGAPALILRGEIEKISSGQINVSKIIDPNEAYPFEGLSSVELEILSNSNIKFVKRQSSTGATYQDGIELPNGKTYSLRYLLTVIKKVLNIDEDKQYCWQNIKKTVKKYNRRFISLAIEYLSNTNELNKLIKQYKQRINK